jgi:hypothetical protein
MMQTKERTIQEVHTETDRALELPHALDSACERLAQVGYRIDRAKTERFAAAGFLPAASEDADAERMLIARLRRILEIERMLAPWRDTDALAFYLAAAGVEGVPATHVARFLAASIPELCAAGQHFARNGSAAVAGLEGERAEGRRIARASLAHFRFGDSAEKKALEGLLSIALIAFVRLRYGTQRPLGQLHRHSRLVNLDAEEESIAKKPRTSGALPPVVDADRMMVWLGSRADAGGESVLAAARMSGAIVKARLKRYPELQVAWREVAEACGYPGLNSLRLLSAVPAVLACAILQAGASESAGVDPLRIMQFWGTSTEAPIRFPLFSGSFPWTPRRLEPAE